MRSAWAGGDFQQSYVQSAYQATTDKWHDVVDWIGNFLGYEWLIIAALVGAPFTVMAILRKLGFLRKGK